MSHESIKQAFSSALQDLQVRSEMTNDGVVRATVDLSSLPILPCNETEPETWRFVLELRPDGTLFVQRPPGLVPLRERLFFQQAAEYEWDGGVPAPPQFHPPTSVRLRRKPRTRDRFYDASLLAALRHRAYDAGVLSLPNCDGDLKRAAARLWKDLWRAIGPHLDAHVATLVTRYQHPWKIYRLLTQRPDLVRLIERAPGIGPRLREIPPGMRTRDAIVELLGFSRESRDATSNSIVVHNYGRSAAFQAWVRSVPWSPQILPDPQLLHDSENSKDLDDPDWFLMRRIAELADDTDALDPNRIRQIRSERAWLLFHIAVARQVPTWLLKAILHNPEAAARAIDRTFPAGGEYGARYAQRVIRALDAILDWSSKACWAAQNSMSWFKSLGYPRPPIAIKEPAERIRGFARLCREVRRYHGRIRQISSGLNSSLSADVIMLLFVPRQIIPQLVNHSDLKWRWDVLRFLLTDPVLRHDPTIRPILLEIATGPNAILGPRSIMDLLLDGIATETKVLWRRLVAQDAILALEYLERHGFDPDAQWQPADLEPLFRLGGDVALRAIRLLALLPKTVPGRSENVLPPSGSQQYDSFDLPPSVQDRPRSQTRR